MKKFFGTLLIASSLTAKNTLENPEVNVVSTTSTTINKHVKELVFVAETIIICRFSLR